MGPARLPRIIRLRGCLGFGSALALALFRGSAAGKAVADRELATWHAGHAAQICARLMVCCLCFSRHRRVPCAESEGETNKRRRASFAPSRDLAASSSPRGPCADSETFRLACGDGASVSAPRAFRERANGRQSSLPTNSQRENYGRLCGPSAKGQGHEASEVRRFCDCHVPLG